MQDPHSPNPIVQRILILLHSLSSPSSLFVFLWILERMNLAEYDALALDLAAKPFLLVTKITDSSFSPAYDPKTLSSIHQLLLA